DSSETPKVCTPSRLCLKYLLLHDNFKVTCTIGIFKVHALNINKIQSFSLKLGLLLMFAFLIDDVHLRKYPIAFSVNLDKSFLHISIAAPKFQKRQLRFLSNYNSYGRLVPTSVVPSGPVLLCAMIVQEEPTWVAPGALPLSVFFYVYDVSDDMIVDIDEDSLLSSDYSLQGNASLCFHRALVACYCSEHIDRPACILLCCCVCPLGEMSRGVMESL
ncbi:hypothetical protein ZWY2020_037983, partial [Hordeum vulgare]